MPTFTAIALDTLLEPGAAKSVDRPVPIPKSASNSKSVPNHRLERRNSASVAETKILRPQITPALYATPEATPLPDSPVSFSPSPYIINHKRRGPRLMKSFSELNVFLQQKNQENEVNWNVKNAERVIASPKKNDPVTFSVGESNEESQVNGIHDYMNYNFDSANGKAEQMAGDIKVRSANGACQSGKVEVGSSSVSYSWAIKDSPKQVGLHSERDSERDDFFDPQDSLVISSNTDGEDNAEADHSVSRTTPVGEFFDAWDDLFSDGEQQKPSHCDIEAQLCELRLSLLTEIEARRQAEEALNDMQNQWQRIRQQLSLDGLTLPDVATVSESKQLDLDSAEDLCQQVYLARFVSNSIGRALARAEMEKEMEAHIEAKNFEIARLLDKLRNYEAMNQEMVQRNRDVIAMPTFTAIALDTLLEPGAAKSVDRPVPIPKSASNSKSVPNHRLERRNSASVAETKILRPQITPALYATPEATPLPDSPVSFSPSPYIINHKRRGPRLMKSFSELNVFLQQKNQENEVNWNVKNAERVIASPKKNDPVTFSVGESNEESQVNGIHDYMNYNFDSANGKAEQMAGDIKVRSANGACQSGKVEVGSSSVSYSWAIKDSPKQVGLHSERDSERDDFFDPQDSLVISSNTDGEDNAEADHSVSRTTPVGEFFDAWDDLFSDGEQQKPSHCDIEAQLCELRLSLLTEIEARRQAEEALNDMQNQWQRIRQQLSLDGLTLPDVATVSESKQLDLDSAEDLCQQVYLARFVSNSIGRALARAEMEKEMEAHIEAKNFEIARLLDKLRNYEAMNQEMVQRNRDVIETARREREKKERTQRWVWGSIATALTLGTAALAWSYLPSGKGSQTYDSQVPESNDAAN